MLPFCKMNVKMRPYSSTIWDRTGKMHRAEGFKVIKTGTWQHMAIVCGKVGMKLYVDGKLAGEDPLKLPFNAISGGTVAESEIRKLLGVGPQNPSEEAYYKALESAHGDGILTPEETAYYQVLQTALTDGALSDSEAAMLQSMQTSLGIGADRAEKLQNDSPAPAMPQPTPKQKAEPILEPAGQ